MTLALLLGATVWQLADLVSFYDMINAGHTELNPLVEWMYQFEPLLPAAAKLGLVAYLWWLYAALEDTDGEWVINVVSIIAIVVGVVGYVSNVGLGA